MQPGAEGAETTSSAIDLDRVMKLRLVVARFGEMDGARWWNTRGQLGRFGAAALKRGFARTYRFAQARAVFAVALQRCTEVFDPPGCVTLFRLPETTEEELDARWERWLDNADSWEPFFERIEKIERLPPSKLASLLHEFGLVGESDLAAAQKLQRSVDAHDVPLPGVFSGTDADVALLALGFSLGEPGTLVVPYAKRAGA